LLPPQGRDVPLEEDAMGIFGPVIQGLGAALDVYQARHRVLAENVANAETPGFRARDLDFGAALTRAFERDGAGEARAGAVEPVVDTRATVKIDGNSVDLDTEMARLSENTMKEVALTRILARKFESLKLAIQGAPR
jgi:flagellar basal-body rod protein FlgB